jgi:GNAT superfamily N-acetyltransferase
MKLETKLFGEEIAFGTDPEAEAYVIDTIYATNPNSEFEIETKELREQYKNRKGDIIPRILERGYRMLLGYAQGKIISHAAYQVHQISEGERVWKVFSRFVRPGFRGQQISVELSKDVVKRAKTMGIKKVRMGKGNHPATKAMNINLKKHERSLGMNIDLETNWVTIS